MQATKKNPFGKAVHKPETIAVIGAGLMGAGIATVVRRRRRAPATTGGSRPNIAPPAVPVPAQSASKGFNVVMKDVTPAAVARGERQINGVLVRRHGALGPPPALWVPSL